MSIQAIASRYAKALYAQVSAQKKLDETLAALRLVRQLAGEIPKLKGFLENPLLTYAEQTKVLHGLFDKNLPAQVVIFLDFIASKRRLDYVLAMVNAFEDLYREEHNEIVMKVRSAYPLDDAFKKHVEDKIARLTGKKVIGEYSVDKAMIGGVRVWAAGKLYEYSFNNELQDYKRKALQTV